MTRQTTRIAVNFGGGYVPGLNAVIAGTVLASNELGWEVVGIQDGYDGLLFPGRYPGGGLVPLTPRDVKHIAAELKVKPEEVTEMETRLAGQEVTFEADQDDDEAYAPVHYLAADSDAEPAQVLEAKQTEQRKNAGLESALTSLDPRSRRIIEARWLREKDGLTLHDLAAEFNVSAERIRQIEVKALEKMRKALPAPA